MREVIGNGAIERVRVAELYVTEGLERLPNEAAGPGEIIALAARVAHADAVVSKTDPVSSLLAAIRALAPGGPVLPAIPRDAE